MLWATRHFVRYMYVFGHPQIKTSSKLYTTASLQLAQNVSSCRATEATAAPRPLIPVRLVALGCRAIPQTGRHRLPSVRHDGSHAAAERTDV